MRPAAATARPAQLVPLRRLEPRTAHCALWAPTRMPWRPPRSPPALRARLGCRARWRAPRRSTTPAWSVAVAGTARVARARSQSAQWAHTTTRRGRAMRARASHARQASTQRRQVAPTVTTARWATTALALALAWNAAPAPIWPPPAARRPPTAPPVRRGPARRCRDSPAAHSATEAALHRAARSRVAAVPRAPSPRAREAPHARPVQTATPRMSAPPAVARRLRSRSSRRRMAL
mmetsp:Transcript_17361/g.55737  ORF Transcript_17361/g.55737 Transcript_17361/m.55737 type:complete len:235 (+) Transcript_17361:1391-2095(+)